MDIKRLFKLICDEWERTIMTVVMLSLLVFLSVTAYNMLMEDEGSSQNNVKPKAPHRFFDTTSTAYIDPAHLPSSINPFNFHIKVALPTPPKHNPQPRTMNVAEVTMCGNKPSVSNQVRCKATMAHRKSKANEKNREGAK